jgi:hypothetical protein
MTQHVMHENPQERDAFLVDGCPRCSEYVDDLGVPFDPGRFRAFWVKMVAVEFQDTGGYASQLDKELGRRLYLVALGLQRGFGIDPAAFVRVGEIVSNLPVTR